MEEYAAVNVEEKEDKDSRNATINYRKRRELGKELRITKKSRQGKNE